MLKVGGRLVETDAGRRALAEAIGRALASPSGASGVVVVHGGGAQVSALGLRLGLQPAFHEGQRVTDANVLRLVSMVLSGEVNKGIVRALVGAGVAAAGLSGEDGATIRADVAAGGALGRVGCGCRVDPSLLRELLAAGYVPVLSPVSLGPDGEALNVNADVAAVAVAVALRASRLVFLSDVPAVRDAAGVEIGTLPVADAEDLVASGAADGGMIPKLAAARDALAGGVADVRIGALDALGAGGTRVVDAPAAAVVEAPA
ncbi:MAG TPA: acetylglutamate kinase [Longimicrobiales bacterium]|nr:acetylglutamate kinase [Longimicrobiales bacterium]